MLDCDPKSPLIKFKMEKRNKKMNKTKKNVEQKRKKIKKNEKKIFLNLVLISKVR